MSSSWNWPRQWHNCSFFMQSLSISKELQWRKQRLFNSVPSLAFLLPTNWGFQLVGPMSLHQRTWVHSYQREQLHFEGLKLWLQAAQPWRFQHKMKHPISRYYENLDQVMEKHAVVFATLQNNFISQNFFISTSYLCPPQKGRVQP